MRHARKIAVVAEDEVARRLQAELGRLPVSWISTGGNQDIVEETADKEIDLILIDLVAAPARAKLGYLIEQLQAIKLTRDIKIAALISKDDLDSIHADGIPDDFVLSPYEPLELETRIKRLLADGQYLNGRDEIQSRDLVVDLAACEVTLGGVPLMLTHKEFELLRFLMANKERVFTRDALLEQVWGYDYYGGDRTVDVHIRRLRSKLNDTDGTYIKTVRNIGYKFNEP